MYAIPTPTAPQGFPVGDLPAGIRLGHDRMRVLLTENGKTRTVGTTFELLSIATERGVPSLRRVQTLDSRELGMLRVEVLMSPSTFAPLRSQSAGLLGASSLAYADGEVRGSVADPDGAATDVALPLAEPVFDAYAVEVILRTLPFEVGYTAQLPAYMPRARAVIPIAVRVESLDDAPADERSWRVSVDFGRFQCTYWIGADTRTVHRQDTLLSSGATLTFVR